jgi:signal transduction histidine kinase
VLFNYADIYNKIVVPLVVGFLFLSVGLYIFLTKPLIHSLFKSDKKFKSIIKETIHELNTPVATIQINTQMLLKKQTDPKNIQRLQKIQKSCNNLIDLYKQMEYDMKKNIDIISAERFDLKTIVDIAIANFDDIKQNITIENQIKNNIYITTDKNGFIKMLNNLISNSIKYNKPNGYVKIDFKDNILNIIDSGCGIDSKNLFKVFDKYYQQDNSNDGIGLGLNIVKEFCDKNKIKINIQSTPTKGTIVSLDVSFCLVN